MTLSDIIKLKLFGGGGGGGSGKDHTFDIPSVTGTYTYDGTSQTPTISGYYSDFMTESGDTSETNAGSYSITFALKDTENCQWRDGTTENKTVLWSISKATPSKPTISASTIRLTPSTLTDTFTVTRDGDGAITATSSDPTKVTASVSGDTVTLTLIDTTSEATVDITVTVAAGTNYLAYTATDVVCEAVIVLIPQGYIVFDSADGTSVTVGKNNGKTWNGTVEYSTDGEAWSEWNGTDTITGLSVYLRGSNNTKISGSNYSGLTLTGTNIHCTGRADALLDYTSTKQGTSPSMSQNCFLDLFNGCAALISAPTLPATTLATNCYRRMFSGCTSLTTAPKLPATTLSDYCYGSMFDGCTSLVNAPELPATTLGAHCYGSMFNNCTSLTTAPELPATTLATTCYGSMFYGCTSLVNAPELPATTLASSCYLFMFSRCTFASVPVLPATTLAIECYKNMFERNQSLTSIPALPATTLADACYQQMFYGCTKIKLSTAQTGDYANAYRIPTNGEGTAGTDSLDTMFGITGGAFTGTPTINTTYYTSNDIVS